MPDRDGLRRRAFNRKGRKVLAKFAKAFAVNIFAKYVTLSYLPRITVFTELMLS